MTVIQCCDLSLGYEGKCVLSHLELSVQEGDYLAIHDTGAHGFSMGYNYNGRLRSAEVLLKEDGSFRQIRRAETPADYFATLDFDHLEP